PDGRGDDRRPARRGRRPPLKKRGRALNAAAEPADVTRRAGGGRVVSSRNPMKSDDLAVPPGAGGDSHDRDGRDGPLPRGAIIGRYVVLGLLGRGGMGEVYAAYDPELDRKVAVKLVRASRDRGVETSEGRVRLLREAQAIAKLSHPNVVTVYDVGTLGT